MTEEERKKKIDKNSIQIRTENDEQELFSEIYIGYNNVQENNVSRISAALDRLDNPICMAELQVELLGI